MRVGMAAFERLVGCLSAHILPPGFCSVGNLVQAPVLTTGAFWFMLHKLDGCYGRD